MSQDKLYDFHTNARLVHEVSGDKIILRSYRRYNREGLYVSVSLKYPKRSDDLMEFMDKALGALGKLVYLLRESSFCTLDFETVVLTHTILGIGGLSLIDESSLEDLVLLVELNMYGQIYG